MGLRDIVPNEVQAKFKLEKYFLGAFQATAERRSRLFWYRLDKPPVRLSCRTSKPFTGEIKS